MASKHWATFVSRVTLPNGLDFMSILNNETQLIGFGEENGYLFLERATTNSLLAQSPCSNSVEKIVGIVPYYLGELTEKFLQDDRIQIARFKCQRAAESKLLEIKERKERRGRSTRAAALSTPVDAGEEDISDDDGEEEREDHVVTVTRSSTWTSLTSAGFVEGVDAE
ncbi:hypothetical protein V2J09_001335 [Rumex salicifolius]